MAEFNDKITQINSGVNSEVSALKTLINEGAKIETGTYVGTGTYGASNPNSLTFFRKPLAVIIFSNDMSNGQLNTLSLVNPMTVAAALYYGANSNGYISGVDGGIVQVEWTDTGVKWYTLVSPSTNKHTLSQMNATGIKYHYLILG